MNCDVYLCRRPRSRLVTLKHREGHHVITVHAQVCATHAESLMQRQRENGSGILAMSKAVV